MNLQVRVAHDDDAAAVCSVMRRSIAECCVADHGNDPALVAAWLDDKTVENTRACIGEPSFYCVVAEISGAVCGFAMCCKDEVRLCYVSPETRFLGVGRALLQALEAHIVNNGFSCVHLESSRTGLGFYRRHGYQVSGPTDTFIGLERQPLSKTLGAYEPPNSQGPMSLGPS